MDFETAIRELEALGTPHNLPGDGLAPAVGDAFRRDDLLRRGKVTAPGVGFVLDDTANSSPLASRQLSITTSGWYKRTISISSLAFRAC